MINKQQNVKKNKQNLNVTIKQNSNKNNKNLKTNIQRNIEKKKKYAKIVVEQLTKKIIINSTFVRKKI